MTVEEIFTELSAHMIQGLMFHDQMNSYYLFLGLNKYACDHEWHYREESESYLRLKQHYFRYHNKLIKDKEIDADLEVIPRSWYNYERKDVDISTKRNAVKEGYEKWIKWEISTKELYQKAYKDLVFLGEVVDAQMVNELLSKVTEELACAQEEYLNKNMLDFNISTIVADQKEEE